MSLSFDLKKVENSTELWGEHDVNPVTKAIIFYCPLIQMGEITEKNWQEFYRRVSAWETVFDPLLYNGDGKVRITAADVKRHIGLTTNVITKSNAHVKKAVWDELMRKADGEVKELLNG